MPIRTNWTRDRERSVSKKTMGLGDSGPPQVPVIVPPTQTTARAENGRPYCVRHNVLMRATGTKESVTHYACPVPDCDCKSKTAKQREPIPREPAVCPQATCRTPVHYLEVDASRTTLALLAMVCPNCGFISRVPRPAIAGVVIPRDDAADDLGAR